MMAAPELGDTVMEAIELALLLRFKSKTSSFKSSGEELEAAVPVLWGTLANKEGNGVKISGHELAEVEPVGEKRFD